MIYGIYNIEICTVSNYSCQPQKENYNSTGIGGVRESEQASIMSELYETHECFEVPSLV